MTTLQLADSDVETIGSALWDRTRATNFDRDLWALAFMFQSDDERAQRLRAEYYSGIEKAPAEARAIPQPSKEGATEG